MMLKACARCGRIHPKNMTCRKNIISNEGEEKALRNTYKWAAKSQEIRERANYLCEVCKDNNEFVYEKLEVHHIEKLRDNKDLLLDNFNLICLCKLCHTKADKGLIDKEYLKQLAYARETNETK